MEKAQQRPNASKKLFLVYIQNSACRKKARGLQLRSTTVLPHGNHGDDGRLRDVAGLLTRGLFSKSIFSVKIVF